MAQTRTVAVSGASGFVGRHVVRALLDAGYGVRALVRDMGKAKRTLPVGAESLTLVSGEVLDPAALTELCRGCIGVVNCVGVIRESRGGLTFRQAHVLAVKALLEAARAAGAERFVQVSALGVNPTSQIPYQMTKFEGEQLVRRNGLAWTILRPGMILGEGSEFIAMAKQWTGGEAAPFIFAPYFTGQVEDTSVPLGPVHRVEPMLQPVAVEDVARAAVIALGSERATGEVFNLVGPKRVSWPELLRWVRDTYTPGSSVEPFGLPGEVAAVAADVASLFGMKHVLPFDSGMARMGSQSSVGETVKMSQELGLTPREAMAGSH